MEEWDDYAPGEEEAKPEAPPEPRSSTLQPLEKPAAGPEGNHTLTIYNGVGAEPIDYHYENGNLTGAQDSRGRPVQLRSQQRFVPGPDGVVRAEESFVTEAQARRDETERSLMQAFGNREFTPADKVRLNDMRNAAAWINQRYESGSISPEEAKSLLDQITQPKALLEAREKNAKLKLEEEHAKQYHQAAARQQAIEQQNAEFRAKSAQQRVTTVQGHDGAVHSFIETAPGKYERLDKGPEREHVRQNIQKTADQIWKEANDTVTGEPRINPATGQPMTYEDALQHAVRRHNALERVLGGPQPNSPAEAADAPAGDQASPDAVQGPPRAGKPFNTKKTEDDAKSYAAAILPEAAKAVSSGTTHAEAPMYKVIQQSYFENRRQADDDRRNPNASVSDEQRDRALSERQSILKTFAKEPDRMPEEVRHRMAGLARITARWAAQHMGGNDSKATVGLPSTLPEVNAKLDALNAKIAAEEKNRNQQAGVGPAGRGFVIP